MTVDWDGQIRMDPSSTYAMQRLIGMKDKFDLRSPATRTMTGTALSPKAQDCCRPTIIFPSPFSIFFNTGRSGASEAAVGKTVVSSQMIDRVTAKLGRKLFEVPVGFKWFVDGLLDGSLGFGGEESAGASFVPSGWQRLDDGQRWNCPGFAGGGDHRPDGA
jgi:phosphoglucomutase